MSAITIGGIVSGLDTTGIVTKLVQVEGNSQTLLTQQQTAQKSAVTAYSSLLTSIGALATQVSTLGNTSTWATTTAASSSPSVTATASGNNATSLTFDVGSVAAAHTLISSDTVGSTATQVSSSGSLTLQKSDGTTSIIDVGSGSLAEVVAGINGANLGLTASSVQTSPGQYRLQVAANSTGASSQFTLDGIDGFSAMNVLAAGADASITVGTGDNAYQVTSATNTFSNVASGVAFTVSKLDSGVTVNTTVDPSAVASQIGAIVTNVNNLLGAITSSTAWDPTTKSGGPLLGDSTVRSLQQSLLSTVSTMNAPGLTVTSNGQLAFDSAAFTTAFKANPSSVTSAYGASSSFTPSSSSVSGTASYVNALASTSGGVFNIDVTGNAKTEQWQAVPPGTGIVGRTLTLTRGSSTINYAVEAGDSVQAAATKLNGKLAEAGFGVSASVDSSGALLLTANSAGSAGAFTASVDGGVTATKVTAGSDVQGTVDGVAATGVGNVLTVPVGSTSRAAGLSIAVKVSDADVAASGGSVGSISYQPGLSQQLSGLFSQMSDSSTGELVTAQATATTQVKSLQTQIDDWTTRLDDYRASLTQKFTAMETALSTLKTQSTALSQYFGTSTASSSSTSSSTSTG
jgi:flagellar hook-associated protein 2